MQTSPEGNRRSALLPLRTTPTLSHPIIPDSCCSEMLVQWSSRDGRSPVVRWGAGPGALDSSSGGASSTYTPLDMCGGAANSTGWVDPGMLHRVVVTGLEPGTRYRYTVGDQVHAASAHVCIKKI